MSKPMACDPEVVCLIDATVRAQTETLTPRFDAPGKHTVKAGKDKPDTVVAKGVEAG
jgi:hypothetical protein